MEPFLLQLDLLVGAQDLFLLELRVAQVVLRLQLDFELVLFEHDHNALPGLEAELEVVLLVQHLDVGRTSRFV